MLTYDQRLDDDRRWAMDQGNVFFSGRSEVFKTAERLAARLDDLGLPSLIEVMLILGMTGGVHRMKKIADVIELMKARDLPLELAEQLHPFVREKYAEFWHGLQVPMPDSPKESERSRHHRMLERL